MTDLTALLSAARDLASDGTNPEYDRALVELVCSFMPDREDDTRAWVKARVLPGAPPLALGDTVEVQSSPYSYLVGRFGEIVDLTAIDCSVAIHDSADAPYVFTHDQLRLVRPRRSAR